MTADPIAGTCHVVSWEGSAGVAGGLEDFSSTLDKAQKMFDQVMAQMKGGGNNSDTWTAIELLQVW